MVDNSKEALVTARELLASDPMAAEAQAPHLPDVDPDCPAIKLATRIAEPMLHWVDFEVGTQLVGR